MTSVNDESLNALVDGELSAEQEAELLERAARDPELSQALCDLRALKHLTRTAYREVPAAPAPGTRRPARRLGWSAAAALVLGVVVAGWLTTGTGLRGGGERFAVLDPDGRGARPAVAADQETRIVFHVLRDEARGVGELLDEVEAMLADYRSRGQRLRVEVVAHAEGLALLRQGLSRHRERIAALADAYPNLAFVACRNTIDRLRVEQGVEVVLLPEAETTASGVAHVVRRQQEGWAYIKV